MKRIKYIFISLIFISILIQCRKPNLGNPGYAIGIVNYFEPGGFSTSKLINYSFFINGKKYGNQYSNRAGGKKWKIPISGDYKQGDQYMVQYNKDNPSCMTCSRMLFDYPVKDSSDYRRYVNEFDTNPPK